MTEEQSHNPFIPSELDESGLPANQFRVLCHLWRRGETYSNAATIAKTCRLKRNTVFEVLADLESAGFIRRNRRPGQTTLIQPVPFGDTGRKANPSPSGIQGASRSGIRHPSPSGIHKGTPTKETPLRKSQGALKMEIPESLPFPSEAFKEAWNDWQQHRREIKKKLTPKSIEKQFKELSAMGESNAIAAIDHSISKGWTGIFPAPSGPTSKPSATPSAGTVTIAGRIFKS
jgi:hypothetical protein